MNFVSMLGATGVAVELKYCERCGGLWLRARGESEVYCGKCRVHVAEMPRPVHERSGKPRLPCPKPEDLQVQVQIDYLQAVTEMEVRP
jgi:Zn-finger nucleic acid-binding protein